MALPTPPLPDPVPLREALRSLRHALRSGGETLAQSVPADTALARGALKTGDEIARRLDGIASDLARLFLGANAPSQSGLQDLADRGLAAGDDFAALSYAGLALILAQLAPRQAYISEAAAREAWRQLQASAPAGGRAAELSAIAAALYLRLREQRVLRDVEAEPAGTLEPGALVPVALFALLLWLQSAPKEASSVEDSLERSGAIGRSRAFAGDLMRADSVRNEARIAELFAQVFRSHRPASQS